MSGICATIDFVADDPRAAGVLKVMARASAHRGPDGIRQRSFGDAHLAHLALRAAAADDSQPVSNSKAQVHLVADARLDNRPELLALLRDELTCAEPSDAALILASYLKWGTASPQHLVGDFAFAVWDEGQRRFFCARDPMGVKPLHYTCCGSLFCVASEAQQILHHPAIPLRFDDLVVGEFLCGGVAHLERSFFRDIACLPPGHRLVVTADGARQDRYWDIDPDRRLIYHRDEDYVEHFRELLERAVQDRLRTSGTTVGISMSGGLDSCSVAALAHRHLTGVGEAAQLLATSFAFDQLDNCDERLYTCAMQAELGLEVAYIDTERFWYLGDEEAYQPSLETPFMSWEGAFKEMLTLLSARGARVILTGHGGDGLVSGSSLVHADRLRRGDLRVVADLIRMTRREGGAIRWSLYRHLLEPWLSPALRRWLSRDQTQSPLPAWLNTKFVQRTGLEEQMTASPGKRRFRELARDRVYNHLVRYGGDGRVAYWLDRFASRFGLEVRHPFFDQRLVEFVHAIPGEQLYRRECTKSLLRRAMVGILPVAVGQRTRKTQFGAFVDMGLREKEAARIDELLKSPVAAEMGIIDRQKVLGAYRAYRDGQVHGDQGRQIWYAITLELWLRHCRDFVARRGREK